MRPETSAAWMAGTAALAVTVAAMTALRPVAFHIDLLDKPGGHKTHSGAVPLVGGLAMLLGAVFGLATAPFALAGLAHFVLSATLLVVVGLLDDRFTLSPRMRLAAQFAAVLPMVVGAGVSISSFGDLFGLGPIHTGPLHLAWTAFVAMAAINAFNMLDGLDGLAGGVALVALGALYSLGSPALAAGNLVLIAVLVGAVVGFLCFNVPVQVNRGIRCFMGDSGSTLLGFSLAWLTIAASQAPTSAVDPITVVWLVLIPATDLVWTVIRRLARGRSPFYADKEHLHHSLLAAGFGVRAVFFTMLVASIVAAVLGLMLDRLEVPEWASLLLLLAAGSSIVVLCRHAAVVLPLLPAWFQRRPGVDSSHPASAAPEPDPVPVSPSRKPE